MSVSYGSAFRSTRLTSCACRCSGERHIPEGYSLVRPSAGGPGAPTDYGLLVPVEAPRSYEVAVALQRELRTLGIGSTLAGTTSGLRVLVWPQHADTARAVARRLRGLSDAA